ncbi:hypothetical protein GF327_00985 [Candidatus Woesearchaeota archaeon]|nr:hypothetical protein [Candidatus Woesearchaeota archaeon]
MNPQIISEEAVSIYNMSKELKKIKKRDGELNIRTKKLEEYLNSFLNLKQEQAEELEKELVKLDVPRLKEMYIKKIIDLMPSTSDELKLILNAYPITVSKKNLDKIVSVLKKYIPKETN